jgi:tetratricopeptide (TPR) repeat protein
MVLAVMAGGAYIVVNREQVRQVVMPAPTPEPTRSAATYAARGALHERDGAFLEAIEAYQAAVELDPTRLEYYLPLVRLLVRENRSVAALELIAAAAELDSENGEVFTLWAAALLSQGNRLSQTGFPTEADLAWQEAVNRAQQATNLNPNNAEANAIKAASWVQLGPEYFEQANEASEIAVALEPDNPVVRQHMATVLENQGYYDQAILEYQLALDQDPNNADLLIGMARNFWATSRIPEAILTFDRAIEVDPLNADAWDGRGYMYFLIGEYPRAEENFWEAYQLDEEMVRAQAHLGAARFRQQNYEGNSGAIPYLEWAVEQYEVVTPSNAIYFNMLGLAYFYTEGVCDEARPLFEQVQEVLPEEPNSQFGIDLCFDAELSQP